MVDDKVVKSFRGVLKDILELELKAGKQDSRDIRVKG